MANNKVCIRVNPIKTAAVLMRTTMHNERREGDKTGSHINKDLCKDNEVLYGAQTCNLWRAVAEDIRNHPYNEDEWIDADITKGDLRYADGGKVRKDATLAAEIEVHYPGELIYDENGFGKPADIEKFNEWKNSTTQFITGKFGEKNVKQVVLHMDESSPHIHAVFVPMYEDEKGRQRLSYHHFINGKKDCAKLQTEYANSVKHLGFERGVKQNGHQYVKLQEARRHMTKSVDIELPDIQPGQTVEEYREIANEAYRTACVQRDVYELENRENKNYYNAMSKKDKIIDKQEQDIFFLKQQNQNMQNHINELEYELKRIKHEKEYERIGAEIFEDKELMKNVYEMIDVFKENGRQYMIEHGIDFTDNNHDGIDDRGGNYIDENDNGIDDRYE